MSHPRHLPGFLYLSSTVHEAVYTYSMKHKNWSLILGIALPLIFIITLCLIIFLPSSFLRPQYDFLFTNSSAYEYPYKPYANIFGVQDGKLVSTPLPEDYVNNNNKAYGGSIDYPPLYRYNVKDDAIHQISKSEGEALSLDPGPSSPDGYLVQYEYNYGNDGIFELFGSSRGNASGYYLTKGRGQRKLRGFDSGSYGSYQGNFKFIGWIK